MKSDGASIAVPRVPWLKEMRAKCAPGKHEKD